jgi:hypothetical protein
MKKSRKITPKKLSIKEAITRFYISDKDLLNKKITELKNLNIGDLVRINFKMAYPENTIVGCVIENKSNLFSIVSTKNHKYIVDKNKIINDLNTYNASGILVDILVKNEQ